MELQNTILLAILITLSFPTKIFAEQERCPRHVSERKGGQDIADVPASNIAIKLSSLTPSLFQKILELYDHTFRAKSVLALASSVEHAEQTIAEIARRINIDFVVGSYVNPRSKLSVGSRKPLDEVIVTFRFESNLPNTESRNARRDEIERLTATFNQLQKDLFLSEGVAVRLR